MRGAAKCECCLAAALAAEGTRAHTVALVRCVLVGGVSALSSEGYAVPHFALQPAVAAHPRALLDARAKCAYKKHYYRPAHCHHESKTRMSYRRMHNAAE